MQIGNAHYNCSCLRYDLTSDAIWLIAGNTAAVAFIIIIIIIIVVAVYRRRRNKDAEDNDACDDNCAGSMEMDEDDINYCTIPAAEADNNANEYCSAGPFELGENNEYSALEPTAPASSASPYYLSLQNTLN